MTAVQWTFQDAREGALRIAQERRRQTAVEGWSPEHDDDHRDQELLAAAVAYILAGGGGDGGQVPLRVMGIGAETVWPWDRSWWKPSDDPIRNLVKAGALVAAEIDRLTRAKDEAERTRPVTVRRDDLLLVVGFMRALEAGPPYDVHPDVRPALARLWQAAG